MIQHKMAFYEPMAQILREAVEVFENELISIEYDDVVPSIQHEETRMNSWRLHRVNPLNSLIRTDH